MNKPNLANYPVKLFKAPSDWEAWLAANHAKADGVWMKIAKKASGIASTNYQQGLETALCYGWIDGQSQSLDDTFYLQKFTPRRPRSMWSARNVGITERLIAQGRMQPAGQAQIDAAKADGRWDSAYTGIKDSDVPPELQAELSKNPKAKAFFDSLNKTSRFPFCYRIHTLKKPETRAARAKEYANMLARGQRLL